MILVLCALLISAVSLEAAVRWILDDGQQLDLEMWKYARDLKRVAPDRELGHEHRPLGRARLMGVDVSLNSNGLRDREIAVQRRPGVFRILMLGDSLTFGWGVPQDSTIPKLLEKRLIEAGFECEVLNAGVGNYNTSMETAYFLSDGRRYHADLVLLGFFINDAERTPRYDIGWWSYHSAAYAYLHARIDVLLRMLGVGAHRNWRTHLTKIYDPSDPSSGWAEAEVAFHRLGVAARTDGAPVVVVNLPELRQLSPYPFAAEERKVAALAMREGFSYLNLLPAVETFPPETLWVAPNDPHPNAKADAIYAMKIFEFLRANGFTEKRSTK